MRTDMVLSRAVRWLAVASAGAFLLLVAGGGVIASDRVEPPHVFEVDLGYLTPVGVEIGCAWGPSRYFETYGQIGIICFDSGTGYDDTNPSRSGLGGFVTYALGLRLRHTWRVKDHKWTRKVFLGVSLRDYSGLGGGNALDCLHCSDWSREADYPLNYFVSAGGRVGPVLASVEIRISDYRGTGYWWGIDPYHVGPTWYDEWDNMCSPKIIVQIAYIGSLHL